MDEKNDVHLYINHFFIALMFIKFRSYRTTENNQHIDSSCHKLSRDNSIQSSPYEGNVLGALTKLRKVIISFVMFVCQSTHLFSLVEQLFSYCRIFTKSDI